MRLLIALFACAWSASAATLYVRTDGTNSNAGTANTAAGAWRNIWYAAANAAAGDTVNLGAGTFNEFVTNTASGTAGNPITFTGQRGGAGEWLTIIDPSILITNWVPAPEIASGIYKSTNCPIVVRDLTIGGKHVMSVFTLGAIPDVSDKYTSPTNLSSGTNFMKVANNTVVTNADSQIYNFWDSVGALYCTVGSTVYLRLRDGSDPSSLTIRGSPNSDVGVTFQNHRPAVLISGKSYINWQNVYVRGAFSLFYLTGSSTHHVTVQSNYLEGACLRVEVDSGAHDNLVQNNVFNVNYYGYTNNGAFEGLTNAPYGDRENIYILCKYCFSSVESSMDADFYAFVSGNSNVVSGNVMTNGIGDSCTLWSTVDAPTVNTIIRSNTISQHISTGVIVAEGQAGTRIYDNALSDCNSQFRIQHLDTTGDSNRLTYIYRNTSWLPDSVGHHIFLNFLNTGSPYYATNWIYNNSFSGGMDGAELGWNIPLTNFYFLNNVFSGPLYFNASQVFYATNWLGAFDYNYVEPMASKPVWFGSHNITNAVPMWTNAAGMSFQLPTNSAAINAAIDTTISFTVGGTYPALPQDYQTKVGSAWDIGALEYSPPGNGVLNVGTAVLWKQ